MAFIEILADGSTNEVSDADVLAMLEGVEDAGVPSVLAVSAPTWAGGGSMAGEDALEAGKGLPPRGITGGRLTEGQLEGKPVKIDWASFTFPTEHLDAVRDLVKPFLKEPAKLKYGMHTYRECEEFPSRAKLLWTEGRREAMLSLNGDSCDLIKNRDKLAVFKTLAKLGAHATRLDGAFDDDKRLVSMDVLHGAATAQNFSGFRRWEPRRVYKDGEIIGDGLYFGRPGKEGSGKQLCIYDKKLESGGEFDGIRYELRMFKAVADEAFKKLVGLDTEKEWACCIANLIGGAIDFVERVQPGQEGQEVKKETHLDRMPRLAWWQKIVDVLGEAVLVVHRVIPPLQKSMEWIRRNILATVALAKIVVEGQGFDFLEILGDELEAAAERINWSRQGHRDLGLNVAEVFG